MAVNATETLQNVQLPWYMSVVLQNS